MDLNNERVFVAGATGMAGISIIQYLLEQFPKVEIVGSWNNTKPIINDSRIEYIHVDFTREVKSLNTIKNCKYAILAAANTGGVQQAQSEPSHQVTDNIVMDALLLESIYNMGIKRCVYISSATVYQEFDGQIKEEQLDLNEEPHSTYLGVGWSKRAAEKLCYFWHEKYGQEILIVRSSNIFGEYDRFDPEKSNFIPALIRKAVDKKDPFEVWGNPSVSRDVIFTKDFARAVVELLMKDSIKFDVFNLGYGSTVTVGEVVDYVLEATQQVSTEIKYLDNKPVAIGSRSLDCSKINHILGWHPEYNIPSAIKITTDWWKDNRSWWPK
jgi:nucleoside-diphosphate-sugar epimerase